MGFFLLNFLEDGQNELKVLVDRIEYTTMRWVLV